MLSTIWNYRSFIAGSVRREFQARYRNSLFGVLWNFIQPLSMILVYTLIFSQIMQSKLPGVDGSYSYSIYLCAGLLTWGLFSEICNRCINIFIDNANLIKKISFPRICLPIIATISSLINFSIIFSIFLVFLLITKKIPGLSLIGVIPLTFLLIFLAIGIGMTLAVLNVFFRDVGQFFSIFIQFWFWFTPIVYPSNILPDFFQKAIQFNPLFPIIKSYQQIFINQSLPDWSSLAYPVVLAFLLNFTGFYLFRKRSGEMVDEL